MDSAGVAGALPRVSLSSSRATETSAGTSAGAQPHGSRTIEGAATVCIEVADPQADLIIPPPLMQVRKTAAALMWRHHKP
jgi:hypothetical protein